VSLRTGFRGSLPYAVAIIGGFLIAYLIVAFLVFPSGVIPGDAKVPNVAGLMFDDAAKRLAEVGFRAQRGETRFHGGAPKETVLEQDPRAGTRDVEGATVTLVVSAGQQMVSVPTIVGMSQGDAQAALEGAGFELGQVLQRPSNLPQGQVIESKPVPGAKAPIPSPVAIVVSAGSSVTLVPNLVGRSVAEARELLQRARLGVGSVSGPTSSGSSGETVVAQSPPAGAQAAVNSRVAIQVGPPGARPR
jgi:eukaryotic-like serine/threonine-protein kinase